jgi:hypothetical protein
MNGPHLKTNKQASLNIFDVNPGFSRSCDCSGRVAAADQVFVDGALEIYSFLYESVEQFHGPTQRLKFGPVRPKLLILRLA